MFHKQLTSILVVLTPRVCLAEKLKLLTVFWFPRVEKVVKRLVNGRNHYSQMKNDNSNPIGFCQVYPSITSHYLRCLPSKFVYGTGENYEELFVET